MLTPVIPTPDRVCRFEWPDIWIGCAEYCEGPTGCTTLEFRPGSLATVDIRGGSPAVTMGLDGTVNGICLAGGSLYGLEAAAGMCRAIGAAEAPPGHTLRTDVDLLPVVRGACIYDFKRPRPNSIYPDKRLGKAAYDVAGVGAFPTGPVGAGRSATVGKMGDDECVVREGGGQGAAFGEFRVGNKSYRVLVCTVVNSLGGIVDRSGTVVRGHLDVKSNTRLRAADIVIPPGGPAGGSGNTTLSVVATDCFMYDYYMRQAARQIHTSMARAIDPFHTVDDGDILFMVRAASLPTPCAPNDDELEEATRKLGMLGSELMWDAILTAW